MTDPVISPDGKWIWTGSEWIPAPPAAVPVSVSIQDSVITGDVTIFQNIDNDIFALMSSISEEHISRVRTYDEENRSIPDSIVDRREKGSYKSERQKRTIDGWEMNKLARHEQIEGRIDNAERHYSEALEIFSKTGERRGEAESLNGLGNVTRIRGDLVEAERLYRKSMEISREITYRLCEAKCLHNLGLNAGILKDEADAIRLFEKSLAIFRDIHHKQGISSCLKSLFYPTHKTDEVKAEEIARELLQIEIEIGSPSSKALWYFFIGLYDYQKQNYVWSELSLLESLNFFRGLDTEDLLLTYSLRVLWSIAKQTGNRADMDKYNAEIDQLKQQGRYIDSKKN